MNTKAVGYWVTNAIIVLELLAGGTADLMRGRTMLVAGDPVIEVMTHLGYPMYLLGILGVWKLLGAIVLLAPGLPRLKEWAYAGTVVLLTGAVASSLASGDSLADQIAPAFLAVCAVASWALRPQSRTLGAIFSTKTREPASDHGTTLLRAR